MSKLVSDAVTQIWKVLGLPAPLDPIADHYDFELEDMPVSLSLTPDGARLRLEATIGQLASDPHLAGDQLSRMLRLSSALASFNCAVLTLPAGRDQTRIATLSISDQGAEPLLVEIHATQPDAVVDALRDLVQWRSYAADIVDPIGAQADSEVAPVRNTTPDAVPNPFDMIVFQP